MKFSYALPAALAALLFSASLVAAGEPGQGPDAPVARPTTRGRLAGASTARSHGGRVASARIVTCGGGASPVTTKGEKSRRIASTRRGSELSRRTATPYARIVIIGTSTRFRTGRRSRGGPRR